MSSRSQVHLTRPFFVKPWVRGFFLVIFYLSIIAGLIILYGKGDFSTPSFIYQGF